MPTTAKGTPYVVSTDLVANYPTVSSDLADHIDDNLAYNAVSINAQTGTTYTFALADASEGKLVTASNAASSTYTVPPQSSVTWAAGAVLRILNQGAGVVTIAAGSGVTINGTPLTLAQYKGAALQRTASNTWTIIPFASGVGSAVITSPAKTGSYTSGGISYDYWELTASTTITVGTDGAGFADVLVVGGGGGANAAGGGGGGGYLDVTNAYLPAGTLTVTIGAGGAASGGANIGNQGVASRVGSYYGVGGGAGGSGSSRGNNGGSGGGGSGGATTSGAGGAADQGNAGGAGALDTGGFNTGGGGGGATAAGSAATTNNGGAGGNGTANSYTGSSVTRAGGGGGGGSSAGGAAGSGGGGAGNAASGNAGGANTGGGGGAGRLNGAAGGSGVVIIRVAV